MSDSGDRYSVGIRGTGWFDRLSRRVFGDRIGVIVFLASVSLFSLYWIADWRINDSLTLYNALYALADGSLAMTDPVYGQTLRTPGVTAVDGDLYGRNYGVLVVSLVPLAMFRGLAVVTDLRLAITGLWVLGLLATTITAGRVIGRERLATRWGSVGALALFGLSVAVATDLDPTRSELYALQFTHLLAGAIAVLFLYRLLARMHGRRAGVFGASLLALGTPLGMWATIPKRHAVTAAIFVAVAYAIYRSREEGVAGTRSEVWYRAGAYALVGLFAWVHAPEALAMVVVLLVVDVPTAPRRDGRALLGIGAAFLLSLLPFFLTNSLAFGSPLTPPRGVAGFPSGSIDGAAGASGGSGAAGGSGGSQPFLAPLFQAINSATLPLIQLASLFWAGFEQITRDPGHLVDVFIRSGSLESDWAAAGADYESVNLTMVESGPILAGLTGLLAATVTLARNGAARHVTWPPDDERVVDAYVVLFAIAMTLLYVDRLPLHAQVTMRYLVPLFPAFVYGLVRLKPVRTVARRHWRTFAWTVAGAVLLGGQLVIAALVVTPLGRGEAFQFHALIGLVAAAPLAVWGVFGTRTHRWGQVGAVALGLATAATTVFLLLATLDYWLVSGRPGLPIVRALSEVVELV